MGAATATFVETFKARDWRHFDVQLLLYVVLLITVGIVMGYSAAFNDPTPAPGMSQTVKTLIWAGIGLTLFFVVVERRLPLAADAVAADLPRRARPPAADDARRAATCSAPRCR